MTVWTNYTVKVTNIRDVNGNLINPNPTLSNPIQVKSMEAEASYILNCMLSDGGIRWDTVAGSPIHPYFGCFAALGLLEAYKRTGSTNYLSAVKRWLYWYSAHMCSDGTIVDHHESGGTSVADFACSSGDSCSDSTDSYAAMFLYTVYNYYQVTNDNEFLNNIYTAVTQAIKGIELTYQSDGLAYAKPNFTIKYLMDNIEVWQGLDAGYKLCLLKNDLSKASNANYKAKKCLSALETLYRGDNYGYYYYYKTGGSITNFSYEGLANMFAIDILLNPTNDSRANLIWRTVKSNIFVNNNLPATNKTGCDQYYWYILAAIRLKDNDMRDRLIAGFSHRWNMQKYTFNSGHNIRRMLYNDFTQPGRISFIIGKGTNQGEVILKWTAVGDDGFSGRAYGYLVKYSIEPIDTIEKFRTANFATGIEPIPRVSGSTETMIIKGLTPGNSYYFAIVAYDESYNYSEISTNILVRAGGTNTITAQLVDDFEVANEINEFGGANTYAYAGTGRIWAGRVSGNPG